VLDEAILTAIRMENEATQGVVKRVEEHMREVQVSGKYRAMEYEEYRIPMIDLEAVI
jgi:hypothetical protein